MDMLLVRGMSYRWVSYHIGKPSFHFTPKEVRRKLIVPEASFGKPNCQPQSDFVTKTAGGKLAGKGKKLVI